MFLKLESARKNERDEDTIPLTSSSHRSAIHSGRDPFPSGRNANTPPLIVKTPNEDVRYPSNHFSSSSMQRHGSTGNHNDITHLPHSPKRQGGGRAQNRWNSSKRGGEGMDHTDNIRRQKSRLNQPSLQNKRSVIFEPPYRRNTYKSPAPVDEARKSAKQRTMEERAEIEGTATLTDLRHNSIGMLDSDGNSSDGGLGGPSGGDNTLRKRKNTYIKSKELITYFAQLARSKNPNDTIDLKLVEKLIKNGANINVTDKYGQTVMHEVAKNWHTDVARFLIKRGAIYDASDRYGRMPLHLASAVGHVEMIEFLFRQNQGMWFVHENISVCVLYKSKV